MKDINDPQRELEGAAFNSAVATLMRLDKTLTIIRDLILDKETQAGWKQYKKYQLTKSLYVQSVALIKNSNKKKELKETIFKLKPYFKKIFSNGNSINVPTFSWKVETQLDDILIEIQEALQKEGYFMPEKESTRGL